MFCFVFPVCGVPVWLRMSRTVTVCAGAPIDLAPYGGEEATPEMLRAATAAIMDSIVTLLTQIRQTSAPPPGGVGDQAPRRDGVN